MGSEITVNTHHSLCPLDCWFSSAAGSALWAEPGCIFRLERSSVGILGCHLDHGCYAQMKYLLQRGCSHSLGELLGEGAHVACFLMHMGHVLTYPEAWAQSAVSQGPHQPFSSQIMRVVETSCLKQRPPVTHS